MFFSRKKGDEEMRKLEQKNCELEEHLAEMRRRLARLENKEDVARGSATMSKDSALKEVYEDQLQQMFQKKLELEEKMERVDKMMTEMEELEKKKREASQIPPLMNTPNNWIPPNIPFYGNMPQTGGMPFPGPQGGGGMMFPGPPVRSPAQFGGPIMPIHQMPQQPPTPQPRGPPSSYQQRPRNNFQSNRGSGPPRRFNTPRHQSPGNYSHQKRGNQESEGQDNKNFFRPPQNRDENKANDLGKDRPLFLNTDKNRSQSQPRNKSRTDKGTANKERGSEKGKEFTQNDQQKQLRTESKGGRRRAPENSQGKYSRNRNSNFNGPIHDRRTVFKASGHKRGQGQHTRGAEVGQPMDSDDTTESANSSGEESPIDLDSSNRTASSRITPDLVKIGKMKEETTGQDKKCIDEKEKKEEISGKDGKKKKKNKNKPKEPKSEREKEKSEEETAPLSKTNLGENEILLKFIGTSIPSLLDAISMDVSLSSRVSGVIVMSDPNDMKPILETPKTLYEIVNFKMKYPAAKSILL